MGITSHRSGTCSTTNPLELQIPDHPLAAAPAVSGMPGSGKSLPGKWCRRRESNPHALLGHKILSLARLPVPPRRHVVRRSAYYGGSAGTLVSECSITRRTPPIAPGARRAPPAAAARRRASASPPRARRSRRRRSSPAAPAAGRPRAPAASASRCARQGLDVGLGARHVLSLAADAARRRARPWSPGPALPTLTALRPKSAPSTVAPTDTAVDSFCSEACCASFWTAAPPCGSSRRAPPASGPASL